MSLPLEKHSRFADLLMESEPLDFGVGGNWKAFVSSVAEFPLKFPPCILQSGSAISADVAIVVEDCNMEV